MKKTIFLRYRVALLFVAFGLQLSNAQAQISNTKCEKIKNGIRQAENDGKHKLQLSNTKLAADMNCITHEQGKKVTHAVLSRWSAVILEKVIPANETASFGPGQLKRLQIYQSDINAMQVYMNNRTRKNWLPALLAIVLSPPDSNEQFAVSLQPIFDGYLDDEESGKLKDVANRSRIGEFIKLLDQGLSLKNISEKSLTSRAFGDPPQVRMMKSRGASFASSSANDDPNSINTPIRFQLGSTELSPRGQQEYKTMLKMLTSNTTKSIFLIGHASPSGSASNNCTLSNQRVQALKQKIIKETQIPAQRITIAWAGENIPLDFGQANAFMQSRDIIDTQTEKSDDDDPMRRRVEIELNGELLRERYAGKFCE